MLCSDCLWLTVKGAGHGGGVGTKQLGGVAFGAFLLVLCIDALQTKAETSLSGVFMCHTANTSQTAPEEPAFINHG